jgi:phage/conjugal plasmid C-4 type zinc finger TraR family protein
MDNADFANDLVLERMERQLAARRPALVGPSAFECEECGEPIPEARREAVPGCFHCIECATLADQLDAQQRGVRRV